MKQEILVEEPTPAVPPRFTFGDMKIGQYARVLTKGRDGSLNLNQWYAGQIVLRTWGGWVSITEPDCTWVNSNGATPDFAVYIYPPGTKFTVTQPALDQ